MSRTRVVRWVCLAAEVALAGVLFWSSVEHLKNPFFFLSNILKYQLVNGTVATIVAAYLPHFQLTLAAMLVLGVARRLSIGTAAALLTLFTAVQISALLRGLEIGCGCFGAANNAPITWYSVAVVAGMAAVPWLTFWWEVRHGQVDEQEKTLEMSNAVVEQCIEATPARSPDEVAV